VEKGEGYWEQLPEIKDMVSAPASRNLSLDQNVQRHILGQGFTPLGEEYSGGELSPEAA
jgi:hypothetical protein